MSGARPPQDPRHGNLPSEAEDSERTGVDTAENGGHDRIETNEYDEDRDIALQQMFTSDRNGERKQQQQQHNMEPQVLSDKAREERETQNPDPAKHEIARPKRRREKVGVLKHIQNIFWSVAKVVLRMEDLPPTKEGRKIPFTVYKDRKTNALKDERRNGKPYINNRIRSSRYSIWSFLPKQLWFQFTKLGNFYFLCIAILQLIPSLSTTGRYTTIVPLLLFVAFAMAKEGFDDVRRYLQDRKENKRMAHVLSLSSQGSDAKEEWIEVQWERIQVGDVIKLERDEPVPADIFLIHAENENGIAYIDTAALDGESNLKGKQALPNVSEHFHGRWGSNSGGLVTSEDPNADLYNFEGKVEIDGEIKPLTMSQVIYRGSVIRNTPSALGLVIFTGEETKIRMNANKRPRTKAPMLQSAVNKTIIFGMFVVVTISSFDLLGYELWKSSHEDRAWYLQGIGVSAFPVWAANIILFNTIVPLSLYVSLELIKIGQLILFSDIDMYDPVSNTPMQPRTTTINEELGQVGFIFSDKTGTLTDNVMLFRKLTIAGYAWTHDPESEVGIAGRNPEETDPEKGKDKAARTKSWTQQQPTDYSTLESRDSMGEERGGRNSSQKRSSVTSQQHKPLELSTDELLTYIQMHPETAYSQKAKMFLLCLALCHTCLPEKHADGHITYQASSPDEVALVQAAQEMGYINIDRQVGSVTLETYPSGPNTDPVTEKYEILEVLEFSSKRKRMSIALRGPDGKICLFSKGADSTMTALLRQKDLAVKANREVEKRSRDRKSTEVLELLRRSSTMRAEEEEKRKSRNSWGGIRRSYTGNRHSMVRTSTDQYNPDRIEEDEEQVGTPEVNAQTPKISYDRGASFDGRRHSRNLSRSKGLDNVIDESAVSNEKFVFERSYQQIHDFASDGLRTLIYAYRYLEESEFKEWQKLYNDATTSLTDRQRMIEDAADKIERDFDFAGATAIEDKLQDGVPDTIEKLRRASIKLWMLTGDKKETAINIGYSCRLLKDVSEIMIIDQDAGDLQTMMQEYLTKIQNHNLAHSVAVVDGATLAEIEESDELSDLFFEITVNVDSVICCRASPNQKAALVRSIRKKVKKVITLAIGDGANDIAMILEAQVGIGITGKEGLAAARSSDYSIAQFRFLQKLLLCHGRWNYVRTCKYMLGTFWKEMFIFIVQCMYQQYNGFTGTSLYENWTLAVVNILFTSLPIIFLGIVEQDLAADTLLAVPELYVFNQRTIYNGLSYFIYVAIAVLEAALVFYTTNSLYSEAILCPNQNLYSIGLLPFTIIVMFVNTKLQILEQHNKTIVAFIVVVVSVGGWFLWHMFIIGYTYSTWTIYSVPKEFVLHIGRDAAWWAVLIFVFACCCIFELSIKSIKTSFFPNEVDHFQALEKDPELKRRLHYAAHTQNVNFFDELDNSPVGNVDSEELKEIIESRRTSKFAYYRLQSKFAHSKREKSDDSIELQDVGNGNNADQPDPENNSKKHFPNGSRWNIFR